MESKQMSRSNRLLAVMAIALAALIAVAAIFVAVRDPASFDPDSPEGVTQAYLNAVLDDDAAAAHALLSPELQARCDVDELEERFYRGEGRRITLVDSNIDGDRARIEVEFTARYRNGPFEFHESSYEERFRLSRLDGEWRISSEPWPYYRCPEVTQ